MEKEWNEREERERLKLKYIGNTTAEERERLKREQ